MTKFFVSACLRASRELRSGPVSLAAGCVLLLLAACLVLPAGSIVAQQLHFRVFFHDKGPDTFAVGSRLYQETRALHTQRCIERRSKVLGPEVLFSLEDAAVYRPYLDSLEALGAHIVHTLRWHNYAVAWIDSAAAESLSSLDFVRSVQRSAERFYPQGCDPVPDSARRIALKPGTGDSGLCGAFDYGFSAAQTLSVNAQSVHSLGISGHNVLLGVLDTGFRWEFHQSTRSINVLAERDFVFNDDRTADEAEDRPGQDGHGTLVLSALAGRAPGVLIGVAPNVDVLLAKTEDLRSETHLEQDHYAAAIEWLEARGADIASSSLGYLLMDSTDEDYVPEDLDGRSPIATRSVNMAVRRGMVCVTSAGNRGPEPSTIIVPGDADSALTIASVTSSGIISNFSSRGPVASANIKPELAAQGSAVFVASTISEDAYNLVNGTSLAAPLVSGSIALMLSVFPELRPADIRRLLQSTASQSDAPDMDLGYGIVDIYRAMLAHDIVIGNQPALYRFLDIYRIVAFVASRRAVQSVTLHLQTEGEAGFRSIPMSFSETSGHYYADFSPADLGTEPLRMYITAEDSRGTRRMPYTEGASISLSPGNNSIPCGLDFAALPQDFPRSAREAIYPSVAQRADGAITLSLATPTAGSIDIDVYDFSGRRACSLRNIPAQSASTFVGIPVHELASGAYMLRADYNGSTKYFPFIIVE